jgi:hypothetical protein
LYNKPKKDDNGNFKTPIESVAFNSETMKYFTKLTVTMIYVFFDNNGHGSEVATQNIEAGSRVIWPADPIDENYLFDG